MLKFFLLFFSRKPSITYIDENHLKETTKVESLLGTNKNGQYRYRGSYLRSHTTIYFVSKDPSLEGFTINIVKYTEEKRNKLITMMNKGTRGFARG